MSVKRIMGIETEYGVHAPDAPDADHGELSHLIVGAYRAASASRGLELNTTWDYVSEDPLRDARGFDLPRAAAHWEQLTHEVSHVVPNVVLPNGGRLYVDHAHPEFSTPEVKSPRDAVRWDRAGDVIAQRAVTEVSKAPQGPHPLLYKNNADGKGASYGTHENYLIPRSLPFEELVELLVPFLITRQVLCGAGQVGIGQEGEEPGFQISQRADFMQRVMALDTTARRPLVNTRDEPHADTKKYRRLHLIIGDANTFDYSTYIKVGSTSAVLALAEEIFAQELPGISNIARQLGELAVADPVREVKLISRNVSLDHQVQLASGELLTSLDIQRRYAALTREVLQLRASVDGQDLDADTAETLDYWDNLLQRLATDPSSCATEVEWLGKYQVLEGLRTRHGLSWGSDRIAAANIQWSDIREDRGLSARLRAAGMVRELITDAEAHQAVDAPPEDTRAWFRGRCVEKFGRMIPAAGWASIVIDTGTAQHRVPMREPLKGTKDLVDSVITSSEDTSSLLRVLTGSK